MKSIVAVLTLLTSVSASAATAWEHSSSGDGTAFEERWVVTSAITSTSSNETLASDMYLGAALHEDGDLFVWVTHRSSELCKFSDWKLAVDKTVIPVDSELGEDTEGTALFPVNDSESAKLLKLFRDGEKIAVRFHANCDNMFYLRFIGTATMTYSLDGSGAALEFLSGDASEIAEGVQRQREENERLRQSLSESTSEMWAVQLGSFADKDDAEMLAADLRKQGYAAFLSQLATDSGQLYRVRVGPQRDRDSANAMASGLAQVGFIGQVVPHP